ncbi:lipopolysaccharide biosynthesis protein [Bacillus wiedmannii]|uniref:lipopolysaccharide biosynthesis protein n=1 Tax=Bacillus wiedmannii TaxID=1890302 RepID=UPI000BEF693D|nr:oligosaccharide flippase family protein [Bacillus wiedmannii]PEM53788.1 hypothetical protein CN618_03520 [Bacillus wiedmannii]PEU24512.1 hypothetical protein CN526_19695 [Bacillus wiedmannii]PHC86603.1 hypothetical protein COF42_16470 [Bacillus wiedmannii]
MKKSLYKSFLGFSIGPLGAALINFITIPVTTRLLSPEEFGKISIFLVIQALGSSLLFLGFDHSYVREFNSSKDKEKLLANTLLLPLLFSIFATVLLLVNKNYLAVELFQDEKNNAIYFIALWVPFIVIERFLLLILRMEERAIIYSVFNILIKFLIMILTVIFLLWKQDYLSVIMANVLGQIVIDVFIIIYIKSKMKINLTLQSIDKKFIIKMLKYGAPLVPTAILMWFLNSNDRLFLNRYSSFENIGIYFAALKVVGIFTVIQLMFTTFWLPIAFRWEKERVSFDKYSEVSELLMFIMFVLFIIILLFKELIIVIISSQYNESLKAIPFLMLYPVMYTVAEATGIGIAISRKTNFNILISIVLVIVNILLNILLVPQFSFVGASISLGLTYVIYFWLKTILSRRLWYKFRVSTYVFYTIALILTATVNLLVLGYFSYVWNIIVLLGVLIFNKKYISQLVNLFILVFSKKEKA